MAKRMVGGQSTREGTAALCPDVSRTINFLTGVEIIWLLFNILILFCSLGPITLEI